MITFPEQQRGDQFYTLQDFEPSESAKLGATISEMWQESYFTKFSDALTSSVWLGMDNAERLADPDAEAFAKSLGGFVKPEDVRGGLTKAQIALKSERQRELLGIKDIRDRTPWSWLGTPVRVAAMLATGIADPINLATAFVPWTRAFGVMSSVRTLAASGSIGGRTLGRFAIGAADGGISTLALEPAFYAASQYLGDDYDAVDSMSNIAMGTAFGGGIHAIGGAGVDAYRAFSRSKAAAAADAAVPAAPVVPEGAVSGAETQIKVGDAYEPARWTVMEADQLQAQVDKADNQFRDRTRAAYQTEIQQRANNIDFNLLGESPVMDLGAPTLAADGRIIGGNGRALFISRAYEIGNGDAYRQPLEAKLADLGIDVDAVRSLKKPVLVRVLQREVDVKQAAMLSNEGGSSAMSPLEQAKVDAERLGDARLDTDADGSLNTATNRAAVRRWVNNQPENQRNALMAEDGSLSAAGLQRLRNAVLFKAYGDSPVLSRLIEATDVGSRNVASALVRSVGSVADARAAIARGELFALDIADDIRMAVEQFDTLRRAGTPVADYLAQMDAFGDPLSPVARLMLSALDRNIASSRRIADIITNYYDAVVRAGSPAQGDMFGATMPDPLQLLDDAIRAAEGTVDTAAEIAAKVSPQTREAALVGSLAQTTDGRFVEVDAVLRSDPAVGTATMADVQANMQANGQVSALRTADLDASAQVDAEIATAPKSYSLLEAEQADADADALLNDVIAAGDQAFKYSRGGKEKAAKFWQGTTVRFAPEDGKPLGGFRWDKINSEAGEGRQAYGYGHYVAQRPSISQQQYRERLVNRVKDRAVAYSIPDGVGGQLFLTSQNDPAYVMPDGSIVHASQKNPIMSAQADAIGQFLFDGYEKAKATFKDLAEGERRSIDNVLIPRANLLEQEEATDAAKSARDNIVKREARFESYNEMLRQLDLLTVEIAPTVRLVDDFYEIFFGDEQFASSGFMTEEAALGAIRNFVLPKRELIPGIRKFEPPRPDYYRTVVRSASGEGRELNPDFSAWAIRMADKDLIAGFEVTEPLQATYGSSLRSVDVDVRGRNRIYDTSDLLENLGMLPNVPDFVRLELQDMLDEGEYSFVIERPGSLYEVEVPEEAFARMMIWDEDVSTQPQIMEIADRWGISIGGRVTLEEVGDGVYVYDAGMGREFTLSRVEFPATEDIVSLNNQSIDEFAPGPDGDTGGDYVALVDEDGESRLFENREQLDAFVRLEYARTAFDLDFIPEYELTRSGRGFNTKYFNQVSDAEDFLTQNFQGSSDGEDFYQRIGVALSQGDYNAEFGDALQAAVSEAARRRGMEEFEAGVEDFGVDELASIMLDQAGVPGHLFADGTTRGEKNPTYNAVVYNDDVAKIINRYARETGEVINAASDSFGLTEALRLSFGADTEALLARGQIKVVSEVSDLPPRPDGIRHFGDTKAITAPNGDVYVVAANVAESEARGMVLHEVGVHVGMREMLGDDLFESVLSDLDKAITRGESWAEKARLSVPEETLPAHVREEQLAYLVQNAPELPIVQRIIAAVRAWAYRNFEVARQNLTLTEADFRAMAVAALHEVARRGEDAVPTEFAYSRGPTQDPAPTRDELKASAEQVKRAKSTAAALRAAADKLDNDAQAVAAMRAAMPDLTKVEIDDLLAQLRAQVKGLRSSVRGMRESMGAEDAAATMQSEAMKAADQMANNIELASVIEARNAKLNAAARLRAQTFVQQFDKPGLDAEGFMALLVGSERLRTGSRVSVDSEYKGFRSAWTGGLIADVEKLGLMKEFASGLFDREIYDALYRMGSDLPLTGIPADALKLAEVVNKYQEASRLTRNRFGAWIRDLKGYITRQSHDMFKIRDAGPGEWVSFVLPKLDLEKMERLGLIDAADPQRSLEYIYDDFAAGVHMKAKAGEDDLVAFGRGSNLAKRESVSRTLYFKDGVAAFEYNQRFGVGRLADSVLTALDQSARSAALLKTLGTNPEAMITRLMDEYEEGLRGNPERRAEFHGKRGSIMNALAQVTGEVNIPGDVKWAKRWAFARSWQSMAKLGGALISSVTDLAGYAAEVRYGQGKNLLAGVADSIGSLVKGRAAGEREDMLVSLGVFHESVVGSVMNRFDNPDLIGGKTAYFMNQFFKLNGLNWWTETLRDGAALSYSRFVGNNTGRRWDALPDELRQMLELYKIDAGKWDIVRMAVFKDKGETFLSGDQLRTVPRAAFENYITSVGRVVNDASVQNLQDDLAQALRVLFIDRAHHAVIEPNARVRAFMLRGTQPGTVGGELLRFIGQFKSFSVAMVQMTLGREVYGRGYDTVGEYLKNGKGDMVGLSTYIGLATMLGYGAMAAKDLIKGREPRSPADYRTWMAAMVQGGGLGIYGDFLFGEYNRMGRTFTASMAGPVLGQADTLLDLWTRARNGDDLAGASVKAFIDNTPFANLFYTRIALDYLILYGIQEVLNPGFLRRMEQRVRSQNDQEYLFPPSQNAFQPF